MSAHSGQAVTTHDLGGRRQLGRRDAVLGGWLFSCAVLLSIALNPGNILAQFPERTFVWCEFVALAAVVYAAGLCLTRWRNPPTLWLAIAFGGFAVFIIEMVGALTASPAASEPWTWILWWVAPLTVSAWVEAALAIARVVPLRHPRRWQKLVRSGIAASASTFRPFLTAVGVQTDKPWVLPWASVLLWVSAALIAAIGSIPGIFFEASSESHEAWRGVIAPALWPYLSFVVFSALALAGATIVLTAARVSVDRAAIKQDDLERLRWAPWAAGVVTLLVAGSEAAISLVSGAQSILDLAIALSALLFALIALNAAAYSNADLAYSSPTRRFIAGALWAALVLYIVGVFPASDVKRAALLAGLVLLLPLLPTAVRAVEGVPRRRRERPVSDEAGRLRKLLTAADGPPPFPLPTTETIDAALSALGRGPITGDQVVINANDLMQLVDSYKGGPRDRDVRTDARLSRFLSRFPPLQSDGDWDDHYTVLMDMVNDTARSLEETRHDYGKHPSGLALVQVVCLKKAGGASRRQQPELHDREQRLVLAYDVWALGPRHQGEAMWFGEALRMSAGDLEAEKKKRVKRLAFSEDHLPPPDKNARNAYERLYASGINDVFLQWILMLERGRAQKATSRE